MSLTSLWLRLADGGLVRADQVTGIDVHPTPEIAGKRSRWLLDVVVATPVGGGDRDGWRTGPLHRTLAQTATRPDDAPAVLARLLHRLDETDAAGILTVGTHELERSDGTRHTVGAGPVRFGFRAFRGPTGSPGTELEGTAAPAELDPVPSAERSRIDALV